jgi:linear primary-alkylsulfatase
MRRTRRVVRLPLHAVGLLIPLALLAPAVQAQAPRAAEPPVTAANARVLDQLPFADRQDFEDAMRGFMGSTTDTARPELYDFLQQANAPSTVNPSLWRLAQLNALHGLFKIADGVYQIRGFSIANMTIVEGKTGVAVIDPLITTESAREALALYFKHRPKRPVVAVMYTHSHADHYAGVKGVTSDADVASGRTRIIAPAGFMQAVVSESVIAGNAMVRRAQYQFGILVPRNERGNVDAGLGKWDSRGTSSTRSVIAPTDSITKAIERRTIDGVQFVLQLAPASEAPAEMHFYLPQSRVLDMAENATHTLHNLLPLRGTEVRDANGWSKFIGEALDLFGGDAQVLIAQHHWPTWGNTRVRHALRTQRDLYKFVHDQSVRLMNHGYAPSEIAEALQLPPNLAREWSARDYYGTLSHDAKAVYQKYIGWYDGNPATLNPLPPTESGKKFVEYMGGSAAVVAKARGDFRQGNYRWVAQVMSQVVFADPSNNEARGLAADALEQLGYLAESATWRNAYLAGAQELRNGPPPARRASLDPDMLRATPLELVFDILGTHVDAGRAQNSRVVINWHFTDTKQRLASTLENAALTYVIGKEEADADASVALSRATFEGLVLRRQTVAGALEQHVITVAGSVGKVSELMELLDEFDASFPLVEPRIRRPR